MYDGEFDRALSPANAEDILLSKPWNPPVGVASYVNSDSAVSVFDTELKRAFFFEVELVIVGFCLNWSPNAAADFGGFFKFPDFNLLHRNWQALGVLFVKWLAIAFHPSFCLSFKCISRTSSSASQEVGVLLDTFCEVDGEAWLADSEDSGDMDSLSLSIVIFFLDPKAFVFSRASKILWVWSSVTEVGPVVRDNRFWEFCGNNLRQFWPRVFRFRL